MAPLGVARPVIYSGAGRDGSTAAKAGDSAEQILTDYPSSQDGVYFINLPTVGATPVYCIMDTNHDGGGWMMALKGTRGTTFGYNANYWTTNNTLNSGATNRSNGDAKFDTFNYYPATNLLDLFQGGEYFIQDAKQFSGYGNAWSSQRDVRFYGYNYTSNNDTRSRWGFGWNENGGGLWPGGNESSNDVGGGIGMRYRGGYNYSAGDVIGCCQDSSGINRSARVEIYVK